MSSGFVGDSFLMSSNTLDRDQLLSRVYILFWDIIDPGPIASVSLRNLLFVV